MHGEITGTINLVNNNAGASVIGGTAFDWNSQYDTQTTRINIPSSATPGQGFDVQIFRICNIAFQLRLVFA